MKQTVKQRLVIYLKAKKIGQNKFEAMANISNGYISHLKNSPSTDVLMKILGAYPELNQNWLLTGEGDMIQPTSGQSAIVGGDGTAVAGNSIRVEVPAIIDKALDEIAAQRMLTQKAQEQLDKAYAQVGKAQEQIDRLITLLEVNISSQSGGKQSDINRT